MKETDNFLVAVRLFELVQVSDLEKLKTSRVNTLSIIETLLKFKTLSDGRFKAAVDELDVQIQKLDQ